MPVRTQDLKQVGVFVREIILIPTELHIVKSVTISRLSAGIVAVEAYAQIGLMLGGTNPEQRICIFDSGYIGSMNALSWTGSIPTEPETYIYAYVWSDIDVVHRLSSVLYRIVTTKEGLFFVDP